MYHQKAGSGIRVFHRGITGPNGSSDCGQEALAFPRRPPDAEPGRNRIRGDMTMKALVVYDSLYGNTEKVAQAIGRTLGPDTRVAAIGDVSVSDVAGFELVLVGSPTQGGRQTPAMKAWLERIPAHGLDGKSVSAFDTRLAASEKGFALRMLMRVIGYAAPRIAGALEAAGGRRVAPPEGFIVGGKEGPLGEAELERAEAWAKGLMVSTR
jgi:flavodoxin I